MIHRLRRLAPAGVIALVVAACGGDSPRPPVTPSAPPQIVQSETPPTPPVVPDGAIAVAGDIGMCGIPEVAATARLLDSFLGTIVATGDLAYPSGTARDFQACYDPSWGRHRPRTRPTPGNHDYETPGAASYFTYFGENAGPVGLGYYSYREGPWLMLSLNSNVAAGTDSAQAAWVRATLAANRTRCALAYWHHPLFSSGPNSNRGEMRDIWRILQDGGVDVVLAGHDHLYERFAPQDAAGRPDPVNGIRQFTVGTGGAHLYAPRTISANSEAIGSVHGVLRMTLKADAYDWQFVAIPGKSFADFGTGQCR